MTKMALLPTQKCADADDDDTYEEFEVFCGKIWTSIAPKPEEVEGVVVTLNGREHSDLDWKASIEEAERWIAQGCKILWKLELGLFDEIAQPLTNERQLTTLKLSLQHFREAIWDIFAHKTIGMLLFEGDVTFNSISGEVLEQTSPFQEWSDLHNAEQLPDELARAYYRRDVVADYLTYLTAALPEELRVIIKLTIPDTLPSSVVIGLLNPDRFDKIEWIFSGKHELHATWVEQGSVLIPIERKNSSRGFCIPYPNWMPQAEGVLEEMLQENSDIRLIPEGAITSRWDQLDELVVLEKYLTPFGKRQLQGFVAAGGQITRK